MNYLKGFSASRLMAMKAKQLNVSVSVNSHKMLSPTVAKVVMTLSTDRCTKDEVAAAITRCMGNGFVPVLGSFRAIPGHDMSVVGFITQHKEVIMASDARFASMRKVTASIMLDPKDDTMWDLRSDAGGQFLVRAGQEDLSQLLVTASVRNFNAPRMEQLASCSAASEFVAFVNPNTGELGKGFVLASDGEQVDVVTDEDEDPISLTEDSIVEAAILHGEEQVAGAKVGVTAADYDSRSKEAMKEYYRKLYAYAPEYVKMIEAQIDAHAVV